MQAWGTGGCRSLTRTYRLEDWIAEACSVQTDSGQRIGVNLGDIAGRERGGGGRSGEERRRKEREIRPEDGDQKGCERRTLSMIDTRRMSKQGRQQKDDTNETDREDS